MITPISQNQTSLPGERINNLIAEVFQGATIVMVGVLGILTFAGTL
jgi:hypothetical protein